MLAFRYDKTFEGLLSAVFDAYTRKEFPGIILEPESIPPLTVSAVHTVTASRPKADRVFAGLGKRLSREGKNTVLLAFLAEAEGMATRLFRYICKAFDAPPGTCPEGDFTDKDILAVDKTARAVYAERCHLLGFARFQKTAEGIFFSAVSPRHNVLALLLPHFMDRFAAHPWILYDVRRGFGFYHESGVISDMRLDDGVFPDGMSPGGMLPSRLLAQNEEAFQEIWRQYLSAATIKERKNEKLQANWLPRRYWPYMTEMRPHTRETGVLTRAGR